MWQKWKNSISGKKRKKVAKNPIFEKTQKITFLDVLTDRRKNAAFGFC